MSLTRQQFLTGGLAAGAGIAGLSQLAQAQDGAPLLLRYTAATIGAGDVAAVAGIYEKTFGYTVVDSGTIDPALAVSWSAPRMASRRFITLKPPSGENCFIRVVSVENDPTFKAASTLGWNSIELVTDNPDKIQEQLAGTPLTIIGPPNNLKSFPSIRAMQVVGLAQEVIHITSETGDQANSPLPPPPKNGGVGRIFIIVLAVPDVAKTNDFYSSTFNLKKNPIRKDPISMINKAQELPEGTPADATYLRMAEQGNSLEFWGMSGKAARPRPRQWEQLPPGVSMGTLAVRNLDAIKGVTWLRAPEVRQGPIYNGKRAATFIGPAGELVELVEV